MRLIARAEQSCEALYKKLCLRKFSRTDAKNTVDRLVEAGLVDDLRYAKLWTTARIRHKTETPAFLILQLQTRGIDRKTARAAVFSVLDSEKEIELLQKYLEKATPEAGRRRDLLREGFSAAAIESVLD